MPRSEPEMQFISPMRGYAKTFLQDEFFKYQAQQLLAMDFSALEDRVVATLVEYKNGQVVYTPIHTQDYYRGKEVDLIIIDDIEPMINPKLDALLREVEKPLKQNGRSASYLSHDPTKRNRKYRP